MIRVLRVLLWPAAAAMLLTGAAGAPEARAAKPRFPCPLVKGPRRAVTKVIDGETIALDDGSRVRLVGALAPRPPASGAGGRSWPPVRAAERTLRALSVGKTVQLGFDKSRRDRYGRVLAQVFVEADGGRRWLQGEMIAAGHARVYSFADQRACTKLLLQREVRARRARKGLWSSAAYTIRRAWRTRELLKFRHTFQIVEGRVRQVASVGRRTFLNFGKRWKDDFTVLIEGRALARWSKSGPALKSLAGRRLRVRGWIERWNGPLIRVSHPEQVEVLGVRAKPARTRAKPR